MRAPLVLSVPIVQNIFSCWPVLFVSTELFVAVVRISSRRQFCDVVASVSVVGMLSEVGGLFVVCICSCVQSSVSDLVVSVSTVVALSLCGKRSMVTCLSSCLPLVNVFSLCMWEGLATCVAMVFFRVFRRVFLV